MTVSPIVLVIGISLGLVALLFGIIQPSFFKQLIDLFTSSLSESPRSDVSEPEEGSLSGTPLPSSEELHSVSPEPSDNSSSLTP